MFKNATGHLTNLNVTVEDNTTWELDKHFQLPKHLSVSAGFRYVGNYSPNSKGKHYELDWLQNNPSGRNDEFPFRRGNGTLDLTRLFEELGQTETYAFPSANIPGGTGAPTTVRGSRQSDFSPTPINLKG